MPENPSNSSANHDELLCRLADDLQNYPEDETVNVSKRYSG